MGQHDETRRVVQAYFDAWTSKQVDAAFALLAPDLVFSGPTADYTTAEAFRPGLAAFAAMTSWAKIVDFLVDGDRAALLYDCELPAPVDVIRIASFFRVAGGRIAAYDTRFDATGFRQLMAQRAGRREA